ncbi:MAG: ABC transporter permease [Candidatus Zixiibacteriota bacterium]
MRRSIIALMKKEFLQILRDPIMLRLIFVVPLIQLLILGYAINTDVKDIDMVIYDFDRSDLSREYANSFTPGGYFVIGGTDIPLNNVRDGLQNDYFRNALIIPSDFSKDVALNLPVKVGMIVDGTNANSAGIAMGYAGFITARFNENKIGIKPPIEVRQKTLYNPEGESVYFMVPGIVGVLLTMITMMLTSMAIVREREIGTLEQLMVTPISAPALIIGKTVPFAVLGFLEMTVALMFGIIWFKIPFAGSYLLLYSLSLIYLFTTLGIGMFVSTITKTQQQAMFLTWFFSIFAILTSGFFTPISNMPNSIQYLTYLNPLRYFMKIIRAIMMKGAGADVLVPEIAAMFIFGAVIFGFAWLRFSKRVS